MSSCDYTSHPAQSPKSIDDGQGRLYLARRGRNLQALHADSQPLGNLARDRHPFCGRLVGARPAHALEQLLRHGGARHLVGDELRMARALEAGAPRRRPAARPTRCASGSARTRRRRRSAASPRTRRRPRLCTRTVSTRRRYSAPRDSPTRRCETAPGAPIGWPPTSQPWLRRDTRLVRPIESTSNTAVASG